MTQYLVAIYHPDDYDPSAEDEAMSCDIDALNDEMVAAVMTCAGGARQPSPVGRRSRCARLGGPTEATERQ